MMLELKSSYHYLMGDLANECPSCELSLFWQTSGQSTWCTIRARVSTKNYLICDGLFMTVSENIIDLQVWVPSPKNRDILSILSGPNIVTFKQICHEQQAKNHCHMEKNRSIWRSKKFAEAKFQPWNLF